MIIFQFLRSPYLIMAIFGITAGSVVMVYNLGEAGRSSRDIKRLMIAFIVSLGLGVCASRLGNWAVMGRDIPDNVIGWIRGGFSGYPGLLCTVAVFLTLARAMGCKVRIAGDAAAPSFVLIHMFMRIGCAFSGCCYGVEVHTSLFGLPLERIPTAAMEAVFCAILFVVLEFKVGSRRLWLYMGAYAAFRFGMDFLRGDAPGVFIPGLGISAAQQIALICLVGFTASWAMQRMQAARMENTGSSGATIGQGKKLFVGRKSG